MTTFGDFARLRETLAWVRDHSPFYRERLASAGLVDDLAAFRARVPRTTKTEVTAEQRIAPPYGRLLAVPLGDVALVHTSPGPIYIPRSVEERGGTPVLVHALETIGVVRGDVAHVTLSYHVMPGGLRLHRAFEERGCIVINGGTGSSELQVQLARELGATVYAGTPTFFANLLDTARKLGLDPRRDLRYRIGFSTAQTLTPALRAEIESGFGVELFDHCGEALVGPVAGECREHRGMHLHRSELFLEFVDPETGEPVAEGAVGEVVATHLGRRAMPLVRYAPGDAYRLLAGDCACGDPSPRVEFVGQVGVIRKVKGVLVHPAQVARVLAEFPEAGRFQILVDRPAGSRYERATLRIGLRSPLAEAAADGWARRVAERVKQHVLLQMDVECAEESAIPEGAAAPGFKDAIVERAGHWMQDVADRRFYAPEIQTLAIERIRALQEERLRRQVARIFERPIAFQKRRLEAAGAGPGDVRGIADLAKIPTVTKDALRESEAAAPPFGDYRGADVTDCVRLGASTGTSGTPTLILWTKKDLEVDYAASARGRWRWGLRPGMSLAQAHPYGLNAGGWMFSRGIERMGVFNVPCGPPVGEKHKRKVAEILRKVKPSMYRLFGNAPEQYSEAARALGYDPVGDLGLEIAGDHPSQQYMSVSSGLESLPLLGTACDEREGCHVCEDLAIVEVVDPATGRTLGHGERGNLVITVLEKDNFQLRYDLEDVVRWNEKPCPCGETHRRLFYEGRVRDFVTAGERRLLPIDVAFVLYELPEISTPSAEYQIVRRKSDMRSLRLRLEFDPSRVGDLEGLRRAITLRLRERHHVDVELELVPRGELPRFAYKAARVVDAD